MLKSTLLFPISILAMLLAIEFGLELRHYLKGYTPLFFAPFVNAKQAYNQENTPASTKTRGPTPDFPFESPIQRGKKSEDELRIWVASASHAIVGADPGSRFPDLLCDQISLSHNPPCSVLNNSKIGIDLNYSIDNIQRLAHHYQPDVIVLYQMSIDIIQMSHHSMANDNNEQHNNTQTQSHSIIDLSPIQKLIEHTSAYGHLREYVSGSIAIQAPLLDQLPSKEIEQYRAKLLRFIEATRNAGATPVLTTFAPSHQIKNQDDMPYYTKLTLMRYQQTLSVKGWLNTIKTLNQTIHEISKEQSVDLIDIEQSMSGQAHNYLDFVHFNIEGHRAAAKVMATGLKNIVAANNTRKAS